MEKLIELLNEYENTDNWENGQQVEFRESKIISKKFGFIEWLVENEKIEWNLDKMTIHYGEQLSLYPINYEHLLMLLSIQDEPIEFLCSILK